MIRASLLFQFHQTSHNAISKYEPIPGPKDKGIDQINATILIDYLGIIITAYRNMN